MWFVWSKTSYSGDNRRCHYAGRRGQQTTEDRANQPMEAGGWVSQLSDFWKKFQNFQKKLDFWKKFKIFGLILDFQ